MNKIREVLVAVVLLFSIPAIGQVTTLSPYSLFGIGDLRPQLNTAQWSMGGLGATFQDGYQVNNFNPASLPYLRMSNLQLGMDYRMLKITGPKVTEPVSNNIAEFTYLGLAFPINDWWSTSINLSPFSSIGYDIRTVEEDPNFGQTAYKFSGKGGLNRVSWSNGFMILDGLSIGASADYIFGTNSQSSDVIFDNSNYLNFKSSQEQTYSTFQFNAGLQYAYHFNDTAFLTIGVVASPSQTLNGTFKRADYTYVINTVNGTDIPVDTSYYIPGRDGGIRLPDRFTIGLNYGHYIEQMGGAAWQIGGEFTMGKWSSFEDFDGNNPYNDSWRAAVGGSITPRFVFPSAKRSNSVFADAAIRLGGYYANTQIEQRGQQVVDMGATFGLSIPFRPRNLAPGENKLNFFNIGIVVGQRGNSNLGIIQEDYVNLIFGVSFSDEWFQKFKYR
ncbi:MAG: outer membrane protein transport protein [Bacteroidota bacterium]|nr:outer membrane protein transport protein [Bacteroidota bacterium]MDX5504895.1 outer membrane protein transport protein [Bacteroidota bacterium]